VKKVAVLGAGSWGTALAIVLADNGHDVRLWSHREEQIAEINKYHTNAKYLPSISLPTTIKGVSKIEEALEDTEVLILAVPSKAVREVSRMFIPFLSEHLQIVHVCKGIEPDTFLRVSEIIEDEIGTYYENGIVILSGPSHAEEVSNRQPTTVTVTSTNMNAAEKIQDLFINNNFRVYTNPDVIGVEIGGALKNIIALGAGISDGLGFGDNAKAALMTRGLAEIARLGMKMGANPLTFAGLSGLGDLIVTCTSSHSRNWRAGNMLGQGYSLGEVLESMGMVVEGVRTTKAAHHLSEQVSVDMPITKAIYSVLFGDHSPKKAVEGLMGRDRTQEMEDLLFNLGKQKPGL
jgi:glycerol-3-phosphate dehydrogenase (NAD(P)+)